MLLKTKGAYLSMKKKSYGNLPSEYCKESSKIVILPVPYDETSTWIKGADKGPDAIIEASANMELYDIETDSEVYKRGIYTSAPIKEKRSPKAMVDEVRNVVKENIRKDKFIVLLGGEHSVSIGSIMAHSEEYNNLSVLQFDAHSDLRQDFEGERNSHACVIAKAREICPVIQVGIRSMCIDEKKYIGKNQVYFAEDIKNDKDWQDKVIRGLKENVYITIDLDVFDPSMMPSTGTPEPGGLDWYEVITLLKKVASKKNIIGFDVVELCPNKINKAPDFTAAKLIYKLLSYKFRGEKHG